MYTSQLAFIFVLCCVAVRELFLFSIVQTNRKRSAAGSIENYCLLRLIKSNRQRARGVPSISVYLIFLLFGVDTVEICFFSHSISQFVI